LLVVALGGCATYVTKEEFSPAMYKEHPVSILVLPPINKTTSAEAKEFYATTVAEPLTNSGYYVYPMEVVYDILQQEGLFDTETMMKIPPQKFGEYFGADAVLYVTLLEWNTKYFITSGSVTVKAACELRSTHTGDLIWYYDEAVEVNTSGSSGGAGGLAGLLVTAISTAVKTATQDYIPVARDASAKIFLAMPFGKYNRDFEKDGKFKVEKKKHPGEPGIGK
ncbi:MAG TPA: GNA1162 family protein, partial [Bacteroidota bacterium]|nr:GNA1162 family protein [Bacteroidota bacterium]